MTSKKGGEQGRGGSHKATARSADAAAIVPAVAELTQTARGAQMTVPEPRCFSHTRALLGRVGQFAQVAATVTSSQPPESPQLPPATTRSAWPSILARALSLLLAFAFAWVAVDRGLGAWVQHEEAIVGRVARYVPHPDPEQLQGLLSLGEPDAPMTAVLACDMAQPKCRRQLATLVTWQGQASKFLRGPNDKGLEMRRLVYLAWPVDAFGQTVAQTVHALDAQGLLWGAIAALASDKTTWTAATLAQALRATEADPKRLARDRDDPEAVLAAQVERTMAEAMEIPRESGVLAAGLPLAATQSEGQALLAALDDSEAQLAENLKFFDGDVSLAQARGLAQLSARARERFIRWILVGKKVSSFPGTVSDDTDDDDDDAGDGEDEKP